jgi:hypothetical protein
MQPQPLKGGRRFNKNQFNHVHDEMDNRLESLLICYE